jgi:hypothetical protein
MRGFNEKLFGDKLYAGQLPTQLGLIGSSDFGTDPDAQAFFDRVTTAGGTLSTTEKQAVNQLVVTMKADGTWGPCKAIYPMVGASAAACAQNLKSSSFTGTFSSGWTFASTGVTPNGSSAFMNTGLIPSSNLGLNNTHLSYYSRTNTTSSAVDIGVLNGSNQTYAIYNYGANRFTAINAPGTISPNLANTLNLIIESRLISTQSKTYKNGLLVETKIRDSSGLPAINIYLGASNFDGSLLGPSTKECAFASIGEGVTDTQAFNFYTAVQAFQTTLSRQV